MPLVGSDESGLPFRDTADAVVDAAVRTTDKKVIDELPTPSSTNAVDCEVGDVLERRWRDTLGFPMGDPPIRFFTRFDVHPWEIRHSRWWVCTPLRITRMERCDHRLIGREPFLEVNDQ
jgi:hypothetical protein